MEKHAAMTGRANLTAAGFALTALSYGLARFAYGLLLPQIREDLSFGAAAAGWIGGSAFLAYCVGIVFAFSTGSRLGPRAVTVLAGAVATASMALAALAPNGWVLGASMTLAGLSTGLTSPPLAAAVAQRFGDRDRPKANGTINAGTAAGIVLSGLAVLLIGSAWRDLYALFAVIGASVTLWLWFAMPAGGSGPGSGPIRLSGMRRPGLLALCVAAFLIGASSTAVWTFGANILRGELAFSERGIALAWIILGVAGIAGFGTGLLTARFGVRRVHGLSVLGMAVAIVGLAAATLAPLLAFVAMGLFGAAYIVVTGAVLIQGVGILPDRPELGLGIPFLTVAVGQTVGAPLFGAILDRMGSRTALMCFALLACLAAVPRKRAAIEP